MRWFGVAMLVLGLLSLLVIWKAYREHPRGELMRRGWTGFVLGIVFSTARWLGGREDLLWVFAILSVAAYGYGLVYMARFIRAQRRDERERRRAKGSPPPLREPRDRQ